MRAIWRGDSNPCELIYGKEYSVIGSTWGGTMFDVIDETGDNYLYPAEDFEVTFRYPWERSPELTEEKGERQNE